MDPLSHDSTAGLRHIKPQSVVDQVADELRRSIVSAELMPGQTLSLRKIADQLGVSFVPVREALRSLEAQGLVVTERARSARVAPLDPEQLHAIYQLRRLIEPDICRRAAPQRTDFTRLEHLLGEFADPTLSHDDREKFHIAFHLELMHPAATEWDLRVLDMLWTSAQRYIRYVFNRKDETDPTEPSRRYDAHALLLQVARNRDGDAMAVAVDDHLLFNERIALEALSADPPA